MKKYHKGVLLSAKCTDDMTDEEWLQARKHGPDGDRDYTIGGSDVAAALGLSPYKSKIEFWEEKKNICTAIEKCQPKDTFKKGHRFEQTIALCLQDDLEEIYGEGNVIVDFDKYLYGCADKLPNGAWKYPYIVVNYDCNIKIFFDGSWHFYLGEIKTLNENDYETQKNYKRGIIPIYYEYQCRYYMKALDVDGIILCCAWGLSSECRAHQLIERDPVIEAEMMDCLDDFYWSLKANIRPSVMDDYNKEKLLEYWGRKYPIPKHELREQIALPDEYRPNIDELLHIDSELIQNKERKAFLEEKRQDILANMFEFFINNKKVAFELDKAHSVYIERKDSCERDKFDEEQFQKDYPAIYDEFCVKKLDVTGLKKKYASLVCKYILVGKPTGKMSFKTTLYDKEQGVATSVYQDAMQVWQQKVKGEKKRA